MKGRIDERTTEYFNYIDTEIAHSVEVLYAVICGQQTRLCMHYDRGGTHVSSVVPIAMDRAVSMCGRGIFEEDGGGTHHEKPIVSVYSLI